MRQLMLVGLFAVMMGAQTLGLDLSLAPGLSIKNAFLYLFLGILLLESIARKGEVEVDLGRQSLWEVHMPFILLILYAALTWLIVSVFFQHWGYEPLIKFMALKSIMVDYYLMFLCFYLGTRTIDDGIWIAKWLLWIIVIGNVITLIDVYNIPDLGIIHERLDGRVSGPLGEANQYGTFATLFLPGLIAGAMAASGWSRILYAFGGFVTLWVLMLTVSRGAFVGLAGGIVIGLFLLRHHLRPGQVVLSTIIFGFLGTITVVVASYQYGDLLYERVIEATETGDLKEVSSGRTELWGKALLQQLQYPITLLTGYGWETFKVFNRYASHNTYLAYFYDLGMIGLVLFLLLIRNVIRVTKRGIENSEGFVHAQLIAFLFGFMSVLIAIFFVNLYGPWLFIWAFIGVMTRLAVGSVAVPVPDTGDDRIREPLTSYRSKGKEMLKRSG